MAVLVLNLHNRSPDAYTMPTAVSSSDSDLRNFVFDLVLLEVHFFCFYYIISFRK